MSFVRTPTGVVMHVDNHAALVAEAKRLGMRGLLLQLEPAEPFDHAPLTVKSIEESIRELKAHPVAPRVDACHPDEACPTCHVELVREHAHRRCPSCGYRDSCCF